MDLYYSLGETAKTELHALLQEAGRAAHLARYCCQGFVSLDHPALATVDNVCGQVEDLLRKAQAHLHLKKETKQLLTPVAKSTQFLRGVVLPSVADADAEALDEARQTRLAGLLDGLHSAVLKADARLNEAILAHSARIFNTGDPPAKLPPFEPNALVAASFAKSVKDVEAEAAQLQKNLAYVTFCEALGNTSHMVQELFSHELLQPGKKDFAQQVINVAGQLENEARAVVALSTQHANPEQHVRNILDKALGTTRNLTENFATKEPAASCGMDPLLETCRQLATACQRRVDNPNPHPLVP